MQLFYRLNIIHILFIFLIYWKLIRLNYLYHLEFIKCKIQTSISINIINLNKYYLIFQKPHFIIFYIIKNMVHKHRTPNFYKISIIFLYPA